MSAYVSTNRIDALRRGSRATTPQHLLLARSIAVVARPKNEPMIVLPLRKQNPLHRNSKRPGLQGVASAVAAVAPASTGGAAASPLCPDGWPLWCLLLSCAALAQVGSGRLVWMAAACANQCSAAPGGRSTCASNLRFPPSQPPPCAHAPTAPTPGFLS